MLLCLAALVAPAAKGASGGVQALVNDLQAYAESGDPAPLKARLHPALQDCVTDIEANAIARFVLTRVRKQGLPDKLETRQVTPRELETLEKQAERMGLAMPVPPSQELRLAYEDYTARLFLAEHGSDLRWVLPCPQPAAAGTQ